MIGSRAQAIVDDLGQGQWSVTVWEDDERGEVLHRRVYTLPGRDGNEAAWAGIEQFEQEMAVLDEGAMQSADPDRNRASLGDHLRRPS